MSALVLDSEALSALARESPIERARVVQAAMQAAQEQRWDTVVPASVLAELYRGGGHDQRVNACLGRHGAIDVIDLEQALARVTGNILARAKRDSADHVDATVIATAANAGTALILTSDPDDLTTLAGDNAGIRIEPLP